MPIRKSTSPVILDTDIGTDIDDTWALAMLLRCPELEPRLISTVSGDTTYRAQVAGAVLSAGGRTDIKIAIGPPKSLPAEVPSWLVGRPQAGLADQYSLSTHPGGVRQDGVNALVECIVESKEPVTVIAIGPLSNIAAALTLEPRIVENARLVAMLGSVRRGLLDDPRPVAEYNVLLDIPACQAALAADWETTIAPLDSCGSVVLDGGRYELLQRSTDPLIETILGSYREWDERTMPPGQIVPEAVGYSSGMSRVRSTILFDTVAIHLAYSEALMDLEDLPISVGDDGYTRVSEGAPEVRVAVDCRREEFLDHLTNRLADPTSL